MPLDDGSQRRRRIFAAANTPPPAGPPGRGHYGYDPPPGSFDVEAVLAEPQIAALLAAGQGHRAYAILEERFRVSINPWERSALWACLRSPRRFLEPASGTVTVFRGFGSFFVRREMPDTTGAAVATKFLGLFFIPIFPLAAYLARQLDTSVIVQKWEILGRAPMPLATRRWRNVGLPLVSAVLTIMVTVLAVTLHYRFSRADVYVTNDLSIPVRVTIAGASEDVAPGGHTKIAGVKEGKYRVVVTRTDGRTIEDQEVVAKGGRALVVNVLGASPLYLAKIHYRASYLDKKDADFTELAGQGFPVIDRPDYAFEQEPESITLPRGSTEETRDVLTRRPEGQVATLGIVWKRDQHLYRELVRKLAVAEPEDGAIVRYAFVVATDPADTLALCDQILAVAPDHAGAHLTRQTALAALGRYDEMLAEYKARHEANPDSPEAAALYARLLPEETERELLEPFARRFPRNELVAEVLGVNALSGGRYAEAVKLFAVVEATPDARGRILASEAAAKMAFEGPEATVKFFAGADQALRDEPAFRSVVGNVVARGTKARVLIPESISLEKLAEMAPDDEERADLYMAWGVVPPATLVVDEPTHEAVRIAIRLRHDVDRALADYEAASPAGRAKLPGLASLLVATEEGRRGHTELAREALARYVKDYSDTAGLQEFVLGAGEPPGTEGMGLGVRAVFEFAASRRTKDAQAREVLRQKAEEHDLTVGLVDDALASWRDP